MGSLTLPPGERTNLQRKITMSCLLGAPYTGLPRSMPNADQCQNFDSNVDQFRSCNELTVFTNHLFVRFFAIFSMAHVTSYPLYKYISLGNWVQKQAANCVIFLNGHAYNVLIRLPFQCMGLNICNVLLMS